MLIFPFDGGSATGLFLLLGALGVDAFLGDMPTLFRQLPHPIVLVGRAVHWLDQRLNRERRSEGVRRARGVVTVVIMVGGTFALGLGLELVLRRLPLGWFVEILAIAVLLAQRSLFDHVAAVADALGRGGVAAGRDAVRHIVGRDPKSLDSFGVARAGIESLAENFSDGVVAPVFWYLVLGLPGLCAYKTANTLDSMIGHRTPRYRSFGWAAARLDDLLNLAPARLSGLLLALAALFVPRARPGTALHTMLRDAGKHRSPNAGWPEAAMAGALGLSLAGPRRYDQLVVDDPWLGSGRARATPADMLRALSVYTVACAIQAVLILALALAFDGATWLQFGAALAG
jgi:adenosylcobinamide-phosphate synthase